MKLSVEEVAEAVVSARRKALADAQDAFIEWSAEKPILAEFVGSLWEALDLEKLTIEQLEALTVLVDGASEADVEVWLKKKVVV